MSHPLFGPEVRLMLEEEDAAGLRSFCEEVHPATVAETLAEDYSAEEAWRVLSAAPIAEQASIFPYFPIDWQVEMAEGAGRPHLARLIEQMSSDDRATLLRELDDRVVEGVLRLVDEADRRDIAQALQYEEGTVGVLMTPEYAWVPVTLTAAVAVDRLRQQAPNSETIYVIYALDERTRRLVGVISLRDLILAPRSRPVTDIMETNLITLKVTDDRERAADLLKEFDFLALPVVDDDGRLVGIVTHDDIMDVIEEEATEDLQRQAAVGPIAENYLEAAFAEVWRSRALWLSALFVFELSTSWAMAYFEDAIAQMLVLALFVPLCISIGGNSGGQAATLITRALALGHVSPGEWLRVLRHEVVMGAALGVTVGVIGLLAGAMTSEKSRAGEREYEHSVLVRVPPGSAPLLAGLGGEVKLPAGAVVDTPVSQDATLRLPAGASIEGCRTDEPDSYRFPKHTTMSQRPVERVWLGLTLGLAVFFVCLWGTLVGSMLPLAFRRMGMDPAYASGPGVATFVDVTGIVIYFSIAKVLLLG